MTESAPGPERPDHELDVESAPILDGEAEPERADAQPDHDDTGSADAPDESMRPRAERMLAEHGETLFRYCSAMLDDTGMATVLPMLFSHVEEHLADADADDPDAVRATLFAVAHNRCIEYGRGRGQAPRGEGLTGDQARVVRALAEIRPVGRGLLLLRSMLGLRWDAMERVCGLPRPRLLGRVCRAWRRVGGMAMLDPKASHPRIASMASTGLAPASEPLGDDPEAWAAIRADARRFAELRHALRQAYADPPRADWHVRVWRQLDEQREQERQQEQERIAARKAAQERDRLERERKAVEPELEPEPPKPTGGAFSDEEDPEGSRPRRSMGWRWLTIGVVLAIVSLTARWLMMR